MCHGLSALRKAVLLGFGFIDLLRRNTACAPPPPTPRSPWHTSSGRYIRSRPAFALLDVVIASIILGISIAAIIGLTGRALSAQKTGEELQIAAMLADEQLALVLARGPDNYSQRFQTNGACDAPFANYQYVVTLSGGSSSEPYAVSVAISWAGGGEGAQRTITIHTLIAPREGDDPDPDRKPPETTDRMT